MELADQEVALLGLRDLEGAQLHTLHSAQQELPDRTELALRLALRLRNGLRSLGLQLLPLPGRPLLSTAVSSTTIASDAVASTTVAPAAIAATLATTTTTPGSATIPAIAPVATRLSPLGALFFPTLSTPRRASLQPHGDCYDHRAPGCAEDLSRRGNGDPKLGLVGPEELCCLGSRLLEAVGHELVGLLPPVVHLCLSLFVLPLVVWLFASRRVTTDRDPADPLRARSDQLAGCILFRIQY
jgi:hypothetical protein